MGQVPERLLNSGNSGRVCEHRNSQRCFPSRFGLTILDQQGNPVPRLELADVATEINASPQQVWAVFTDFSRYPEWSTYIEEVEGRAETGARLRVVMRLAGQQPLDVRVPLAEVTPGARLAWRAVIPGAAWLPGAVFGGVHEFLLTALPDGRTRFVQREHLTGLLAEAARKKVPGIAEAFAAFNDALKNRVEKLV